MIPRLRGASRAGLARAALLALAAACALSSCAYYNTFYLARRYYAKATAGEPYPIEKAPGASTQDYAKSIEYSKKLISFHPKSKWVDDAYLLWARALLGQDDPLETINMLEAFPVRFPQSTLKAEAQFYLGVAYRQSRKYRNAVRTLDEFLAAAPKHDLAPYAHLERARSLTSLEEPGLAAEAASQVLEQFPKSDLAHRARIARAEALFQAEHYEEARRDFRELGARSETDEDRLRYLLREADALDAGQQWDEALALLRDQLAHERPPVLPDTAGGRPLVVQQTPGYDRYGRLLTRIGTVHLRAGRLDEALTAYRRVVEDYPRDPIAAEAQFRIGYAYETLGDDFDRARQEYQAVRSQAGQVGFGAQATERLYNLDRIAQFRSSAATDTTQKQIETAFLLAEQYLFQLEKPERALEEYQAIAAKYAGTPAEAKALNAQAWVLARKLERKAAADSLFWKVVREHPATEAQLAARDYLESNGQQVPAELIVLPPEPVVAPDTTAELTPPPASVPGIGASLRPDSSAILGAPRRPGVPGDDEDEFGMIRRANAPRDTTRAPFGAPDSTARRTFGLPDTTRRFGAPGDTTGRRSGFPDSLLRRPPTPPPPSPRDSAGVDPR
jgi:tetratricopeptide (TPR) repeat protein